MITCITINITCSAHVMKINWLCSFGSDPYTNSISLTIQWNRFICPEGLIWRQFPLETLTSWEKRLVIVSLLLCHFLKGLFQWQNLKKWTVSQETMIDRWFYRKTLFLQELVAYRNYQDENRGKEKDRTVGPILTDKPVNKWISELPSN